MGFWDNEYIFYVIISLSIVLYSSGTMKSTVYDYSFYLLISAENNQYL